MAIVFAKGNKRQIYSIIILIVLVIIFIFLIVALIREKPGKTVIKNEMIAPPEIDFTNLQSPLLLKLEPFFLTPEVVDTVGRNNPFVSLSTTTGTSTKK